MWPATGSRQSRKQDGAIEACYDRRMYARGLFLWISFYLSQTQFWVYGRKLRSWGTSQKQIGAHPYRGTRQFSASVRILYHVHILRLRVGRKTYIYCNNIQSSNIRKFGKHAAKSWNAFPLYVLPRVVNLCTTAKISRAISQWFFPEPWMQFYHCKLYLPLRPRIFPQKHGCNSATSCENDPTQIPSEFPPNGLWVQV